MDTRLNFHQLLVFYVVARRQSFSRAAEELQVSQPAVSIQVRELEASIGTPLLERLRRGLQLTETGALVYDYAHRIFSLAEEMQAAVEDIRGGRRGRLTLGASSTPGEYVLPEAIGRFKERHPGMEMTLLVTNTEATLRQVLRREVDLGMVGALVESPEVAVIPYVEDEIALVAGPQHPLASRDRVTLQDIAQEEFVVREKGSATRRTAEDTLASHGITLRVNMELGSNEAVKRAVATGVGLGIISRYGITAEVQARMLVQLPVEGWHCVRSLVLIHRHDKHLTSGQMAFLRFLREERPLPPIP